MDASRGAGVELDWNDLKVAITVAREGSLSGAGRTLGLDQSTVGRRLTALEAAIGATLFVRTRAGVALSEAGQQLIDLAVEVETRVERLPEAVSQVERGVSGTVSIEGVQWVLNRLVAVALPGLLARHPELDVELSGVPRSPPVWTGRPTVGLWFQQAPTSGAFAIKLGGVPYVPCVSVDARLPLTWAVEAGGEVWDRATRNAAGPGLGEPVGLTVSCTTALAAAVATGRFRAFLPECLVADDPRMSRITMAAADRSRDLYLHAHPDTVGLARVQAVIGWLREQFGPTFAGKA